MLHEVGLSSTILQPSDYAQLFENGIGLTDLARYSSAALPGDALYAARLLAFNGKTTASLFYRGGTHRLSYGRQSERIGETAVLRAAFHRGDERLLDY